MSYVHDIIHIVHYIRRKEDVGKEGRKKRTNTDNLQQPQRLRKKYIYIYMCIRTPSYMMMYVCKALGAGIWYLHGSPWPWDLLRHVCPPKAFLGCAANRAAAMEPDRVGLRLVATSALAPAQIKAFLEKPHGNCTICTTQVIVWVVYTSTCGLPVATKRSLLIHIRAHAVHV